MSIAIWKEGRRLEVLRWSPTKMRKAEALRDRLMRGYGTEEPWIGNDVMELSADLGRPATTMQWRKPLSIAEVAQMAPTPEAQERKGRP